MFSNDFMRKHQNVTVYSDLLDAHMYLMKPSVLDFLREEANRDISTVKGELLPKLVRRQWYKPKGTKEPPAEKDALDSSSDEFELAEPK